MAGKQPKERFDDGYKIGSTTDPTRPISATDLVILQDVSETDLTKAVRTGLVSDIFKDMSSGANHEFYFTDADGVIHLFQFVNGLLTYYDTMEGTGVELDPYLIDSPQKLNWVRNDLDAYYEQTADISLAKYANWVPIGDTVNMFTGHYDGGEFTISDLTCVTTGADQHSGLFMTVSGAAISNVVMDTVDLTSDYSCGALAGTGDTASTFTNIIVTNAVMEGTDCGGLIGSNSANVDNYTKCYAEVDITATANGGGIAGYGGGVLDECYSEGTITADTAGGLVGSVALGSTATDSYSACVVVGTTYAGGLFGYFDDGGFTETVDYAFAVGAVSGAGTNGGLVADVAYDAAVFTECYWDTETTGQATSDAGTGKTTAQMKTDSLYAAWSALKWTIVNGQYPVLKWL